MSLGHVVLYICDEAFYFSLEVPELSCFYTIGRVLEGHQFRLGVPRTAICLDRLQKNSTPRQLRPDSGQRNDIPLSSRPPARYLNPSRNLKFTQTNPPIKMSSPIAFIIGAGKNVGLHTAAALKQKGYQVAVGSRKPVVDEAKKSGYHPIAVSAESPDSIKAAFAQVTKELGPPSVVVFNAAVSVPPPVPADPLTLPFEAFKQHTDIVVSVYAAAQEAVAAFRSPANKDALKTFIVTGNALPWIPAKFLQVMGLNVEKTAVWRLMELLSNAYAKEGIRFYYAALVGDQGGFLSDITKFFTSGPQHGEVYSDLVTRKDQAEWEFRFTEDAKQFKV
ncbi:hypothetical protein R3P38DRAFT_2845079 [Favolaschia claudopus]|uniref:NAD(P)-binding protein n=1 Tax=Favolaschia claudopus TaxID=2862362 RepID=A0AAW0DPU9_9AGAR